MIGLIRNGGSVDIFLHGEYGFCSMGVWCYSRKSVWNSRAKLRLQGSKIPIGFHYRNLILVI